MKIQLNTDKNIHGTEKLESLVSERINHSLKQFAENITRIEVHLSDQNGHKTGADDIQCKIESSIEGLQPVVVISNNSSKEKAGSTRSGKMKSFLTTITGKIISME